MAEITHQEAREYAGLPDGPKVVAIIQARMASTRLPGKVLLPLGPENKSVLWWMVKRAGMAKLVDEVIVATTTKSSNDPIWHCGDQSYISLFINSLKNSRFSALVYRYDGLEDDVIGRVLACANEFYDADIIVDLTADCPMVDPRHIDYLINELTHWKTADYASNDIVDRSWPDGLDIQVYWTKTLQACKDKHNPKQHCGWNIPVCGGVNTFEGHAPPEMYWPELGLTLDTPEDYELLKILFNKFGKDPGFHVEDVIRFLRNNPQLVEINKKVRRKAPEEG